jgi:hypothetical protein
VVPYRIPARKLLVAARLLHARGSMIRESSIEEFTVSLRGDLILPEHSEYEEARKIYNGMIDKRPSMILRCADVADVIAAVNFGRENGMLMAIRGGGHNGAGLCTCDDGLVIDLSPLNYVRVDPRARTVRVGAGCTWGDVDHAAQPFGLAVPAGVVSTTGVAGLTLGGGHGYLTRKYGLTIDNLISADVVLADGSFVTASDRENADLFWALRGGGGNFGVVTSFQFKAHPVGTIYGGPTLWNMDRAAEILRWYRDFSLQAHEDLYGFYAFLKVPPGPPFPEEFHFRSMCGIVWCYLGPLDQAENVFAPVRDLDPALGLTHEMPFPALQSAFDPLLPPGLQWYWKGDFVNEINDEAVDLHVRYGSRLPSLLSTMHMYPIDGAVQRVGRNDTAFSYRDANWSMVIAGIDPDPGNADPITAWTKEYWKALHPYSAGGAYLNFMMEEGQDRVRDTYRDNYDRLVEVKTKYDPKNLFRVNWNIQPRTT